MRRSAPLHPLVLALLPPLAAGVCVPGCAPEEPQAESAAAVAGQLPELTLDDGDARIVYSGAPSWLVRTDCCGTASFHVSPGAGSPARAAELSFEGGEWDTVLYYGCKGPSHGSAAISIDGVRVATVNAAQSGSTRCDQLLYTSPALEAGTHHFRVTAIGARATSVDKLVLRRTRLPHRLSISGRRLFDGPTEIALRGGNFEGIMRRGTAAEKEAEARDFTDTFGFNFARYRISFENAPGESCLSAEQEGYLDDLHYLTDRGVWVLLEMRADDDWSARDARFYVPGSALNTRYKCAWSTVVRRVKELPFIAGYGLLAEPSTNKLYAAQAALPQLLAFQRDLMDHLSREEGDLWTPFFVGTDYNYDTMQYRHDEYFTEIPEEYRPRLIYEVNFLNPKPWINEGCRPGPDLQRWDLGEPIAYPQPDPRGEDPYGYFVTPNAGPFEGEDGLEVEQVFNRHIEDPEKFWRLLSPSFIPWYLEPALSFAARHDVPMVVDQFGAADVSDSGVLVEGQVEYERDLLDYFEAQGLGWSRWAYDAGDHSRRMNEVADTPIRAFYQGRAR